MLLSHQSAGAPLVPEHVNCRGYFDMMDMEFFHEVFNGLDILRGVVRHYNFDCSPSTEYFLVNKICYGLVVVVPGFGPFWVRNKRTARVNNVPVSLGFWHQHGIDIDF